MKWTLLFLAGLAAIAAVHAGEDSIEKLVEELSLEEMEEVFAEMERQKADVSRENEIARNIAADHLNGLPKAVVEIDPCEAMACGAGRVCELKEDDKPECVCIPFCPEESEVRRHVCTNMNDTWPSDCSVYQQRCLCDMNLPGCLDPKNTHLHIDYYGVCHEQQECTADDLENFSVRMRDWLFNIMRDLAERDELTEHYMQMELEAETNMTRRWANAAVWKWCDLDGDTDRSVSRHELFPIRAPLVSLEHCIAPFLESCDSNKDHRITLVEWGACLGLDESDLNERCDDIHKTTPQLLG